MVIGISKEEMGNGNLERGAMGVLTLQRFPERGVDIS